MNILCLCKRRPQGRDLLERPYGRFFHLPRELARRGHQVTVALLGYRDDPAEHRTAQGIEWHTESLFPVTEKWGPRRYLAAVDQLAARLQPDWIVGFSDTWYGILAERLAERHGCRSLIDAYDNYESYIPAAKPLHWIWRRALRRATALSAAGPQLAALMSTGRTGTPAVVIPMAADPNFVPMIRADCRKRLGLPTDAPLVGYIGSLHRNRGVKTLGLLAERLLSERPDARLVLSGRRAARLALPAALSGRVIELGYLADENVPILLNAMNVALAINKPSAFGDYSYPVKIYEAMRCGIPLVAAGVAGTAWILRDHPECLVSPGNVEEMTTKVANALGAGRIEYSGQTNWVASAARLESLLESAT